MDAATLYQLASALRALALAVARNPGEESLPVTQIALIECVARRPRSTIGEIAEMTQLRQSLVSRTVDQLVDPGFLVREPDPRDGRRSLVSISPAGLRLVRERTERSVEQVLGLMHPHLNSNARDRLLRLLAQAAELLGKAQPQVGTTSSSSRKPRASGTRS